MTPTHYIDKQWSADFMQGYHLGLCFSRSGMVRKGQLMQYAIYFAAEMMTSREYRKTA